VIDLKKIFVLHGSTLAINLLAMIPANHINIAKTSDRTSLPTVGKLNEMQAKKITFSLSQPNKRIGLVKL